MHLRQPSPSGSTISGSHLEPPLSYDALAAQNTSLRTRVNELELVNNLFRDRVNELEASEQQARADAQGSRETEAQLRAELEDTRQREVELKRRLDEIESDEEGPRHKKIRMSDVVDESRVGSPVNPMATE